MNKPASEKFRLRPAVFVVFRDGNKVLLLRRANTGYGDGKFSMPAGHVDGGEPAHVAAAREALEETGVTIRPDTLRLVHLQHRVAEEGAHEYIDIYFEATEWSGPIRNAEPEKCSELRWVDISELPDDTTAPVRLALGSIRRGLAYSYHNFS